MLARPTGNQKQGKHKYYIGYFSMIREKGNLTINLRQRCAQASPYPAASCTSGRLVLPVRSAVTRVAILCACRRPLYGIMNCLIWSFPSASSQASRASGGMISGMRFFSLCTSARRSFALVVSTEKVLITSPVSWFVQGAITIPIEKIRFSGR
jgi:hypothetical protein